MLTLDHCIFTLQSAGGISRWWLDHTKCIQSRFGSRVNNIGFYQNENVYLASEGTPGLRASGELPALWAFRPISTPAGTQVFHSSYFRRCIRGRGANTVLTFHDDIALSHHSLRAFVKRRWMAACVAEAFLVHCISEFSRRAFLKRFPWFPGSRTRVIHHAFSPAGPLSDTPLPYIGGDDFVLWVGNRFGYKNGHICFSALAAIKKLRMVFVGGEPRSNAENAVIRKLKLDHRVHFVNKIPLAQLNWLYRHAVALWYPSLNEGFGMPVIEAASHGCPVLACAGHAVQEIGCGWPLLSERPDADWLATQTRRLLTDRALAADLKDSGPSIAARYSWKRYADDMASLYAEAGLITA